MSEAKKDKKFWVGRLLLAVLFLFAAWLYYELELNYRSLEATNKTVDEVLEKQSVLTQQYAKEIITAKQKVAETEKRIAETEVIVAQLKQENAVLQEKVKLLDKMAELEANIAQMKEKNTALLNEIDRLEKETLLHPEKVKSLDEGRTLMAKFRSRFQGLERRIHAIKQEMHTAKVTAQKEIDKKRSLVGNNGFLVRNGMAMPRDIILPSGDDKVKVDVKIVK